MPGALALQGHSRAPGWTGPLPAEAVQALLGAVLAARRADAAEATRSTAPAATTVAERAFVPPQRDEPELPPEDTTGSWALVQRAQAGDSDAFGELYDRYSDLVYRYVYYRVSSQALAEDLTSETFLRALRRISSFTWQGRDFGAWLVTIARNLIADHYKSGRYRLEVTTDDLLGIDATPAEAGPETEVISAMTNAAVMDALRQLNPEQQECLMLRFVQGLSVAETAQAMGKNDGAIKALQYRAVRSLGRLLPQELVA